MEQISIFDGNNKLLIDKPIRLVELFGGYGSQALALKYLGVPFEHHALSEWAVKSIQAYKDMHSPDDDSDYSETLKTDEIRGWLLGRISSDYSTPMTEKQIARLTDAAVRKIYNNMMATKNLGSIMAVKGPDLDIKETDKYCYIMTYSFPYATDATRCITGPMAIFLPKDLLKWDGASRARIRLRSCGAKNAKKVRFAPILYCGATNGTDLFRLKDFATAERK